jgi:hypothetical protein
MIWADRVAVGALALAAVFFAYLYATDESGKDAATARLEYFAEVGFCDITKVMRKGPEPCVVSAMRPVKIRTLGGTGVEFLIVGFGGVLPAWLVLRLVEVRFRRLRPSR